MIDAYVWTTPNGFKLLVALEELGLPYTPHWVAIGKGDQHKPEYLAINPNAKIPAIVDRDANVTVFESGAVLLYLAEKAGKLLPKDPAARAVVTEWMFFNAANTGPMLGQLGFFKRASEQVPMAIERYTKESERILGVLDGRLAQVPYLAGEFSIADIMNFTWILAARDYLKLDLARWPHLLRWVTDLEKRPASQKALAMKP